MTLDEDTVLATRQHFADLQLACIAEVENGSVKVNDEGSYVQSRLQAREEYLAGKRDHTLTFRQFATWLLTGECRALLP